MARLTISPTAAPQLQGVSYILKNASDAFDSGFNTAKGTLDLYNQGVTEKNDAELAKELAGLSTQEDLAKFLSSDFTKGRQFSAQANKDLLGMRDQILGYGKTIADTNLVDANTTDVLSQAKFRDGVQTDEGYSRVGLNKANTALTYANTTGQNLRNQYAPNQEADRAAAA